MFDASIAVPGKNEAVNVALCLDIIFAQDYQGEFGLFVIDSRWEAEALEIARAYSVTLVERPPKELRHGGMGNLVANLGQGKYIAYITADAFAKDAYWLRKLTAGLGKPEVAGVYGRQLSREDTWPMEASC